MLATSVAADSNSVADFILSAALTEQTVGLDTETTEQASEHPTKKTKVVYKRDPYTVSEDGHFVGIDGFVVPRDFAEFYTRYPDFVRGFVRRKWMRASQAEIEDRVSELLIFLMDLPSDSKYREPGYNGYENGCTDRIQVFHPDSSYGASAARFFSYLNICLTRHFFSLTKKAGSNPIRRYNTLSLFSPDSNGDMVDEDYIYTMAADAYVNDTNFDDRIERVLLMSEFRKYVETHNPELVAVIDAVLRMETLVEAQKELDMNEKLFLRARSRLGVLHHWFLMGEEPPRQRRVYRRKAKAVATA